MIIDITVDSPENVCLWPREIHLSFSEVGHWLLSSPTVTKESPNSRGWSDFKYRILLSLWAHLYTFLCTLDGIQPISGWQTDCSVGNKWMKPGWSADKGSISPLSAQKFYSLLFLPWLITLHCRERTLSDTLRFNNLQVGSPFLPWKSNPQQWVFKLIHLCCHTAQPIYHSNLCKCHSSIQLYVSCILRLHSSWGLCKANLSWINQEIPWCMLYVEEDILFRSRREVLPSLLKWTNPLSAVYLYTFRNTSKDLLGPAAVLCRHWGLWV